MPVDALGDIGHILFHDVGRIALGIDSHRNKRSACCRLDRLSASHPSISNKVIRTDIEGNGIAEEERVGVPAAEGLLPLMELPALRNQRKRHARTAPRRRPLAPFVILKVNAPRTPAAITTTTQTIIRTVLIRSTLTSPPAAITSGNKQYQRVISVLKWRTQFKKMRDALCKSGRSGKSMRLRARTSSENLRLGRDLSIAACKSPGSVKSILTSPPPTSPSRERTHRPLDHPGEPISWRRANLNSQEH